MQRRFWNRREVLALLVSAPFAQATQGAEETQARTSIALDIASLKNPL